MKRYIDDDLKNILEYMGAVLIIGPKWCGKTTTAMQFAKTIIELQHPTKGRSYIELADADPFSLLDGEKPLLVDEWQMAPKLWDDICYIVDKSDDYGLYILTGSTVVDNTMDHSGTGRFDRLKMSPMSFYENIPEPSFLAVITGDNVARVRKDGVMVIPIGVLR